MTEVYHFKHFFLNVFVGWGWGGGGGGGEWRPRALRSGSTQHIIQSDYSILDTHFYPLIIVWLYHVRLIKNIQSLYVTWPSVFVKSDLSDTIQS